MRVLLATLLLVVLGTGRELWAKDETVALIKVSEFVLGQSLQDVQKLIEIRKLRLTRSSETKEGLQVVHLTDEGSTLTSLAFTADSVVRIQGPTAQLPGGGLHVGDSELDCIKVVGEPALTDFSEWQGIDGCLSPHKRMHFVYSNFEFDITLTRADKESSWKAEFFTLYKARYRYLIKQPSSPGLGRRFRPESRLRRPFGRAQTGTDIGHRQ